MSSSSDMQNFPSTKNQRILFLIKKNHMRDASEQEFYCTLWPRLQNPFFHCLKQQKNLLMMLCLITIPHPFTFFHLSYV